MGAELFRANRRTDRHEEANSRLSQSFGMRLKIAERLLSRFQASYEGGPKVTGNIFWWAGPL